MMRATPPTPDDRRGSDPDLPPDPLAPTLPPSGGDRTVDDLVIECVHALEEQGESGVARVCARFPHHAEAVRMQLRQLDALGLLRRPAAGGVPATIGPYAVRREIASGGMGSVYLAEQQHPVRRWVALKLIKTGFQGHRVVERFRAEQQALALMSHPCIARVRRRCDRRRDVVARDGVRARPADHDLLRRRARRPRAAAAPVHRGVRCGAPRTPEGSCTAT